MVGNVCVTNFMGLESDLIFQGIKRVSLDDQRALNESAIEYAFGQGWLNEWERDFCLSTRRKRKLSGLQADKRAQINAMVLSRISRKV